MPFKIVLKGENNQDQLTVCPSGWESNGTLYWPRKKVKKQVNVPNEANVSLEGYLLKLSSYKSFITGCLP